MFATTFDSQTNVVWHHVSQHHRIKNIDAARNCFNIFLPRVFVMLCNNFEIPSVPVGPAILIGQGTFQSIR
jgi:hypothetical protein